MTGEAIGKVKDAAKTVAKKVVQAVTAVRDNINSGPTRPRIRNPRANAFRDRTLRTPRQGAGFGGPNSPEVYKKTMEGTRRGNAESGRGVGF